MVNPTGYVISCDESGCNRAEQHENWFKLCRLIEDAGWQRGVKLNGERAKRGGKDYCPEHRHGSAEVA